VEDLDTLLTVFQLMLTQVTEVVGVMEAILAATVVQE
jgi:hypothetical protein